jgi:hypothetical protein
MDETRAERLAAAAYNELYGPGAAEHGKRFASTDWLRFEEAMSSALQATRPTDPGEDKVEAVIARLCDLHKKMLLAYQRQRPYPVSIALGQSDLDTVLDAAVELERVKAIAAMGPSGEDDLA